MTKVIIMAGGYGSRLSGLLPPGTPKSLADIDGTPFIDILLDKLEAEPWEKEIIIGTGHLHEEVAAHVGSRARPSLDTVINGTASFFSRLMMRERGDHFVVLNGDTFQDAAIKDVLDAHHETGRLITASVTPHKQCAGIFIISREIRLAPWLMLQRNLDDLWLRQCRKWMPDSVNLVTSQEPFYDIGTPEGLETFRAFWRDRKRSLQGVRTA